MTIENLEKATRIKAAIDTINGIAEKSSRTGTNPTFYIRSPGTDVSAIGIENAIGEENYKSIVNVANSMFKTFLAERKKKLEEAFADL